MRRRATLFGLAGGLAVVAGAAPAWAADKVARIGILCGHENLSNFITALAAAGYEEGRGAQLTVKAGDGAATLERLARELVARPVDLIVAMSMAETEAARRVTTSVPIVMAYGLAPVELGLAASLAQPGGNITGTVAYPTELVAKGVEALRETLPRMRRLGVLVHTDPWSTVFLRAATRAATVLGIETTALVIAHAGDVDAAFTALQRQRVDAITVCQSLLAVSDQVIDAAARHKVPALHPFVPALRAGGLMALAPDLPRVYERTVSIIDRVLRGAPAARTPIEEPTHFVLAVNQRVARDLGLDIPRSILLRARVFND